jgi:hypothetical protein
MWLKWIVIGLTASSALLTVGIVGEPRKPITALTAMLTVLVDAALIVGMLYYWK